MKIKIALLTIMVAFLFIPSGLSISKSNSAMNESWTFMVYMDADNSLSQYAPSDLAEMMSVGSSENLKIVVLYDSTKNGDSAIYLIENGKKVLLKSLGEVDMGSEGTLRYFIDFVVDNYSSTHYFLDFWDHGNNYGGVCIDHGDWLTLTEIQSALKYFTERIGHRVDVVGFDACRMGAISVFYALKDYAYYAVASEKDEPANGWPYDDILSHFNQKTPEQVSKLVVDSMYSWARNTYSEDGLSVIMAYVNLTRMDWFVDEFNQELMNSMPVVPYFSKKIIDITADVERYEYSVDADFYDLMEKIELLKDYKLSSLARTVMNGIESIIYYRAWDCPNPANGYHAKHAHGMAIYYPTYYVDFSYKATDFAKNTYWVDFLTLLHQYHYIYGYGDVGVKLKNGNITVNYTTSGSMVEIYLVNEINSTVFYSGILNPLGKYEVSVPYGIYDIYLYSYNESGYVVWAYKKTVENLKKIVIGGKIFINGNLVVGARIGLQVDNRTYWTVQSARGFNFTLYYPRDIGNSSRVKIRVIYGWLSWEHDVNLEHLKGSSYFYVKINESIFPGEIPMIIFASTITILGMAMLLWKRR